jgi:hypothetical protein
VALGVCPVYDFSDEHKGTNRCRERAYGLPSVLSFLRKSRLLDLYFCVLRHCMACWTTIQQTQLAARTAPPRHPNSSVPLAVILVSLLFLSIAFIVGVTGSGAGALATLFFGGIVVVALGYWLNKDFQKDVERHTRAIDSWRNSVICLRCGHAWQRRIRVLRSGLTRQARELTHVNATSNSMRP